MVTSVHGQIFFLHAREESANFAVEPKKFILEEHETFISGGRDVVLERGETFSNLIALSGGGVGEDVVELQTIDQNRFAERRAVLR
ncbi:MAG: hypothetical protein SR1Q5_10070 [Quinella sp. 1Q5]|nr:hypothetical protein [Quinella sp. 1Q5]